MHVISAGLVAACGIAAALPLAASQEVRIEGDDILMRGCVVESEAQLRMPFETILWSRGGILTAGAAVADTPAAPSRADLTSRVFYWVDDDELAKYRGKIVEVRGELGDIETGEIEFDRDGEFTEIRLDLGGREEEIRVPTAWLDPAPRRGDGDRSEVKIATRKVDIDEIDVVGDCD